MIFTIIDNKTIQKLIILKAKSIELLAEMNGQIEFLEAEFEDEILRAEEIIGVIIRTIETLKKLVVKYKFKNRNEEIHFFKEVKPQFTSKLYYYNTILRIETQKPVGGKDVLKKFYQSELDKIKAFFDDNLDFYRYYRFRNTFLDEKYFLRGNFDYKTKLENFFIELDPKFSTSHDNKVALIMANDLLTIFIDKKILNLENSNQLNSQRNHNAKLTWTGSKVALTELIYALQTEGVFNNGAASLKDIVEFFEVALNVELGQYRRNFLEIRARKDDKMKFLSSLMSKLNKRIDDNDEFY